MRSTDVVELKSLSIFNSHQERWIDELTKTTSTMARFHYLFELLCYVIDHENCTAHLLSQQALVRIEVDLIKPNLIYLLNLALSILLLMQPKNNRCRLPQLRLLNAKCSTIFLHLLTMAMQLGGKLSKKLIPVHLQSTVLHFNF